MRTWTESRLEFIRRNKTAQRCPVQVSEEIDHPKAPRKLGWKQANVISMRKADHMKAKP